MPVKPVNAPQNMISGKAVTFQIPPDLLKHFEKAPRVIIRGGGIVCIPAPEALIKVGVLKESFKEFDVVLVPKEFMK